MQENFGTVAERTVNSSASVPTIAPQGAMAAIGRPDTKPKVDAPCACGSLRRASRCVSQLYDLVLAPCSLKCTQFVALRAIDEAGEIAQYQFARQYSVAVETLSRRLGALRRKGLVRVRKGTRHGEQIYSLTDEGKRLLMQAHPYWERAQERLKAALGEAEWNLLFTLTDRIANAALDAENLRLRNSDQSRAAA
jgi:DNA-binding MarR family transcriptional regulator